MKAVFVDGASFQHMRPALGINNVKFYQLCKILTQEIGTTGLQSKPIYVMPANIEEKIGKQVRSAGFVTVVKESVDGEDDNEIIRGIRELDSTITEIILVSSDQDFVPVLRERVYQGVKIFWVATKKPGEDGSSSLAAALDPLFEGGTFQFVELADYKERIMSSAWVPRSKLQMETKDSRSVRISVEMGGTPEDIQRLLTEAVKLLVERFPFAKFTIECK